MLKIENQEGTVLAFLNNLTEATVKEAINGEYILNFVATIDHLKTDYLYNENNLINYNDDLFRVATIEELHDEDDALTVACECEHISYDLIDNAMNDFNYIYKSASEVMINCLFGTDFTLRYCEPTKKTDIQYTKECNSKQILIAIANDWNGELKYYRHYVDLLQRRGANRGTGFIFGKNLKSVKRIINRADKTTSYDVEVVEGTETEELGYYELGDTVRIMDERLNVDYECRIVELEKDILTGLNSNVILGDAIKDMRSTFSKNREYMDAVGDASKEYATNAANDAYDQACKESMPYWEKLDAVLDDLGNLLPQKLKGDLSLATVSILNSTGTFEHRDNGLYWQNQPTKAASTFATFWGAQGIMFARSKDENGEWRWESAMTAEGVVATKVIASALEGLTVKSVTSESSTMKTSTLEGCTIKGGELWIGENIDGFFTGCCITKDGFVKGYYQGTQTYSIVHTPSGKLRLISPTTGTEVILDSYKNELYSSKSGFTIQNGVDYESYDGRKVNTRIEVNRDVIDLYVFSSGGSQPGGVYVHGNLHVEGDIYCYKCITQE